MITASSHAPKDIGQESVVHTFCRATRQRNELRQFAPYEALWYQ